MKRNLLKLLPAVLFFIIHTAYSQHTGLDFYRNLSDLPYIYPNVESYYISSYDRTGGNDDGFTGKYSQLYEDENGEHVIFEEKGPGCVYNIWGTGPDMLPNWGIIKFYFDGEKSPRFEMDSNDFFSGLIEPYICPLINHRYTSSGGFGSSVPFPFKKSLKITAEKQVYFYNIYYQLYKDIKLNSWSKNTNYSDLITLFNSCGSDPKRDKYDRIIRKNVSLSKKQGRKDPDCKTLLELNKGGTILYIRINPLYEPDIYNLNHIFLKITYDGRKEPSVNVPVGYFFGSGIGETDIRSLFVGMSASGTYYSYFPMPFKTSVKIELENRGQDSGGRFFTEIAYSEKLPEIKDGVPFGYFGAEYRREFPIVKAEDYVLFDFKGRGAVVGQVMAVEPVKPDIKQWWEGDMRIYIDGEQNPRFHGTGHEDEYQGGWSNFWISNPYSLPLFGMPKSVGLVNIYGQINASVTAYRFWPGKIPFKKSILISTEHGTENKKAANYSSLVYYYFVE